MKKISLITLITAVFLYVFSFSLRYWKLTKIAPFVDDQARDAITVMEHLDQHKPFVLGPKASVGNFSVQPFYYYFISIPILLFHGNPDAISLSIIIIESFTPVLLYLFIKRYWNEQSGQITGFLYAVSPFIIIFSSFAWSPNLIPFFSVLMLFSSFEYLIRGKKWMIVLSFVSAVLAFQMHYQATILFLYLIFVFLYALIVQKKSLLPWLVAGMVGVLTLIPLLFDLNLTLQNMHNLIQFFTKEHSKIYQTVRTFPFFWNYIPQVFEHALGFESDGFKYGRIIFLLTYGYLFLNSSRQVIKTRKMDQTSLLFMFISIAFVGLRLYKGDKLEYYLLFMVFIPALSLGILVGQLRRKIKALGMLAVALIVFSAGKANPAAINKIQRDYEVFTRIVGVIDSRYAPSYYLAGVPYTFFQNSFYYVWKYQYGKTPWTDENNVSSKHIYICSPEQRCSDLFCAPHENNEYVNEEIAVKEYSQSYAFVDQFMFDLQDRKVQVVMYEKK